MTVTTQDTKTQLELRLLLAAAARVGIAPTVSTSGTGAVEMIAAVSDRGARLVRDRRAVAVSCKACGASWQGVLVPEGALEVGCPSCEGELVLASPALAAPALASASGATAILVGDPVTVASPHSEVPAAPVEPRSDIPARIGPYRVVKVLGRGGMGAVVEAVDERSNARVAVKLIAGWSVSDLDARLRFEREGKVLTLLAHPHIVRFVERGEQGDQLYIAMELVAGRSLADLLEAGPLSVAEAARVARAIAEGLGYAHALGLVHRDVKPGNVLLGDDGSIKLADFGLVRRREESLALTAPGTVVGTPVYMAPEQLEGGMAGPPADLYALGVMLYHMVAGAPPFTGSFVQIAAQRQKNEIVPLRAKRPECPESLQALVGRLLARDGTKRPTATETARILGALEPPSTVTSVGAASVGVPGPGARPATASREARSLVAGDAIGPFTIEAKLGAGGMGSVFKARRADGSLVALKLIARPLDPNASQRFAREARALAEASHPNVVRFLDAGESDGLSWIATELVPGRSLDQVVLAQGALPEARLLDIAEAVARGLAALHDKKIVHRDVKPQNIMVKDDGGVVLVDLGLAKFLAAETAVTETGALVGTPHYMAPEQLLGRPVEARTDLYALGAVLYHAATGRRPFDGETTTAVAFQQVNVAPRAVRAINRKLSQPFATLVARLLEKRVESRPASAHATLALIGRVRRGEALDEARSRIARAVGVVLAILVVACVVAIWAASRNKEIGVPYAGRDAVLAKAPAPPAETVASATPERTLGAATPPEVASNFGAGKTVNEPAPVAQPRVDQPAVRPVPGPAARRGPPSGGSGSGEKPSALAREDTGETLDGEKANAQGLALEKTRDELKRRAKTTAALGDSDRKEESGPELDTGKKKDAAPAPAVDKLRATDQARMLRVSDELYVDAAPVTAKQWRLFRAAANGAEHFSCDAKNEPRDFKHAVPVLGTDDEPVRGLDFWAADAYARWSGARLPTTAEWEKAVLAHPELGAAGWLVESKDAPADKAPEPAKLGLRCVKSSE